VVAVGRRRLVGCGYHDTSGAKWAV